MTPLELECIDPNREATNGQVVINGLTRIEDKWVDYYSVQCVHCSQKFKVIEREYHYTWWGWSLA